MAREPTIIWTILGSCVSVSFWSRERGVGALCHATLPRHPGPGSLTPGEDHRFMDYAIRDIARRFDQLGATRAEVQVKLFGGADVLPIVDPASSRPTVGRLNQQAALETLHHERFELSAASLGGGVGMKIYFNTGTGEVLLRRLK